MQDLRPTLALNGVPVDMETRNTHTVTNIREVVFLQLFCVFSGILIVFEAVLKIWGYLVLPTLPQSITDRFLPAAFERTTGPDPASAGADRAAHRPSARSRDGLPLDYLAGSRLDSKRGGRV